MTTTVVSKVGSAGAPSRDYSTFQAWEDACPSSLTSDDKIWKCEAYNDSTFDWSGPGGSSILVIAGMTVDANRYVWVSVAAGQSFADNVTASDALRYDEAKGVAIHSTMGSGTSVIQFNVRYCRLSRMQIFQDGYAYGLPILFTGSGVYEFDAEDCIFRVKSDRNIFVSNSACDLRWTNVLWYGGKVQFVAYGSTTRIINCTGVYTYSGATEGAMRVDWSSVILKCCLLFSTRQSSSMTFANSGAVDTTNSLRNGVQDASGFGANSIYNLTASNIFRSLTADSEDFRIADADSSGVKTGANDQSTYTGGVDIINQTRNGTTPTMGAWEYIGGGGGGKAPPPPMRRMGLPRLIQF